MKIRIKVIAALLTLIIVLGVPTIMAYFVRQDTAQNEFIVPEVTCVINEQFDGEFKKSITVQNTGDIKAYIRLKITHHWIDSKDNIVGRQSELDDFILGTDWLKIGDTYYYSKPVDPTDSTLDLLASGESIELKTTYDEHGGVRFVYKQVVEIHAEAIQAEPASTVETIWGVNVENGIIQKSN